MSPTTDGGKNFGLRGGLHGSLYVADASAARDQSRPPIEHAVPHAADFVVGIVARTHQIALESLMKRGVELVAGFGHRMLSLRWRRCIYRREIMPRKTEKAGTDHRRSSTKNVAATIASNKKMPISVNNGCAGRRMGSLKRRSPVSALRKRRSVLRITSHTKSIPATAMP